MGNVFANGREVSGKATPNKSVASLPTVCLSPPAPPAGPIPIPYPVTSMGSDTADGTGSVKVKKKETGKKNGSTYKKCNGNQPATRNFGADVVSHTITGKTKFAAYSFDVFFEKGGAERFLDLTTSNHMNPSGSVTTSIANLNPVVPTAGCKELKDSNDDFRKKSGKSSGTITTAKHTPSGGGTPEISRGYSSMSTFSTIAQKAWVAANGFAKGVFGDGKRVQVTEGKKKKTKIRSNMNDNPDCGTRYYGNNAQCGATHAEARIIEDILKKGSGGSLLLAIDWPNNDPVPCTKCEKTIAQACKCFDKIETCNDNNQKVDQCA